jgi:hypothetical protein
MKFIKPSEISSKIMSLIEETDEYIILVSPYVKISKWYKLLKKIDGLKSRNIPFSFYIREGDDNLNSALELEDLCYKFSEIPNLHAKLYLNEKQAIVTSLNLLLSSEINSIELGYITESTEEHAELVEFCKRQLSIDFDFQKATTKPKNSGNWQKDICNSLSSALDEKVIISQVDGLLKIKTGSGQYECFIWSSNTNLLRISGILSAKEYESARNPVGYFASHTGFKIELQPGSAKYPNLVWCTLEKNLQSQDISKLIEADITFVSEKIIDFVTTIEEFRSEN